MYSTNIDPYMAKMLIIKQIAYYKSGKNCKIKNYFVYLYYYEKAKITTTTNPAVIVCL